MRYPTALSLILLAGLVPATAAAQQPGQTAGATRPNLRVLQNLPEAQLFPLMNVIATSLGVHCDFCHAVDEKTGWNFPSDEKKEKKTAREMIAMVMKINKEQFGGRAEVSCWTCHRGSTHPVSLVSLPQGPPPFPTPKPVLPDLPPLEEVVKKYAAALGDASKLATPRALKGTREAFDGKPLPLDVQQSGARWHVTVATPAGPVEQVVTENGGWSKVPKGVVREIDASGLENFRELAAALEPTLPSEIPENARVINKERVSGNDTVVVAFRNGNIRQRLYFDMNTNLLIHRMVTRETPIGEVPSVSDFGDWKETSGARFPFMVRTWLVDPWVGSTRHYTEVKLDAKVADAAFAKPK